jgi:3-hydroxyacyl-CoA dehydrogenase
MEKIGIIGAGLVGRAWAMVFARAGHVVKIHDADAAVMPKAIELIRTGLVELREAGLIRELPADVAARVTKAATIDQAVGDADYVQENTAERLDVKQAVYAKLDAAAPPTCILASSTSTFPASAFTAELAGRQRCVVAHPVNPPHIVPVVEIAAAPWTSGDVVARTRDLQQRVGQVPIIVKREVPGFILNRLQAALLNEAWRLVKEDYVSVEDLDKVIKDGLGLRWAFMGPFETIDLNAPGGITDYARRYGPVMQGLMKGVTYEPWDAKLVEKVDAERRELLPQSEHAAREAWRDRRLMALIAHKRACEAKM